MMPRAFDHNSGLRMAVSTTNWIFASVGVLRSSNVCAMRWAPVEEGDLELVIIVWRIQSSLTMIMSELRATTASHDDL